MNVAVKISRVMDIVTRKVTLAGMTDIMFDRYPGDNNTKLKLSAMADIGRIAPEDIPSASI